MDEIPTTRIALGPIEITVHRRGVDEPRRVGLLGSVAVHVTVIVGLILLGPYWNVDREAPPSDPPVAITFAEPFPPAPKPEPTPKVRMKPPPPPTTGTLRMQAPPEETIAAVKPRTPEKHSGELGRRDTKPAGGESGGPLPDPKPGMPENKADGLARTEPENPATSVEPPSDLQGRLRDFRRALEAPDPAGPTGPKGGGKGTGGLSMPDVPPTGMGIGNLEFESREYDWSSYARSIYWAIWRAWHNRLLASSGNFERWAAEHQRFLVDARSKIVFTIERSGQITGVAIESPSGCYPFDESAADALREVVLPPLPPDFTKDSERVHATFIGEELNIRVMRVALQRWKDLGLF